MKMKKVLLCVLLFISHLSHAQSEIKATIDERVELMSIVFRLAGSSEYNFDHAKQYVQAINVHFAPYKNHPLITYATQLKEERKLGYDAVMAMAVHLHLHRGNVLQIEESENTLDGRWGKEQQKKFTTLLADFYKESKFNRFFKSHRKEYSKVTEAFDKVMKDFNQEWYTHFYGKAPEEQFHIVLGYGIGPCNYGVKAIPQTDKKQVYAIIGCNRFNENGDIYFTSAHHLPTLVHEFNHSFINYLLQTKPSNYQAMQESGATIQKAVEKEMKKQGYNNWESIINESLVRSAVIRYLTHNSDTLSVENEIKEQVNRYFLWVPALAELLGTYEEQREKYSTFEEFYPEIIRFFGKTANQINDLVEKANSYKGPTIPD